MYKKIQLLICLSSLFFIIPSSVCKAEDKGSVYLGPFLSIVKYIPPKETLLTIGDYGPFSFEKKDQTSKPVLDDLDLTKTYKVKVHFDGEVVSSWDLDFDKIGSCEVCIWRAKGSWRMEPMENSRCQNEE